MRKIKQILIKTWWGNQILSRLSTSFSEQFMFRLRGAYLKLNKRISKNESVLTREKKALVELKGSIECLRKKRETSKEEIQSNSSSAKEELRAGNRKAAETLTQNIVREKNLLKNEESLLNELEECYKKGLSSIKAEIDKIRKMESIKESLKNAIEGLETIDEMTPKKAHSIRLDAMLAYLRSELIN